MRTVTVGEFSLEIPDGTAGENAIRMARPILVGDEYRLLDIRRDGHWPVYFVDVGAYVGAFSLRVADLFPGATVLAFEPDQASIACFRTNLRGARADVRLYDKAVIGEGSPGTRPFRVVPDEPSGNHLLPHDSVKWMYPTELRDKTVEVDTVRLTDILAAEHFPRIDLLKLDCEGEEGVILEDLANAGWLRATRWVRFEWHGRDNIDRCTKALAPTHVVWTQTSPQINGFGLAHSRKDARSA
jgi:FkbM family methyltransferase